MQKVTFTRTVKVAKGDGSGPTYEKGKTYWMRPDSVDYWRSEDAVIDAHPDAVAVNNPLLPAVRPENVVLRRTRGGRYHVYGPNDHRFSDRPLTADEAELLRKDVLDGKIKLPAPEKAEPVPTNDPQPIELAQVVDADDKKTVYVVKEWPAATTISEELLTSDLIPNDMFRLEDDIVKITVANGAASYRAVGEKDVWGNQIYAFIAGSFNPPPPPSV